MYPSKERYKPKKFNHKEIIAMEKTQDIENKLDIAYEILCLVAVKFNKSFPSNYHENLLTSILLKNLIKHIKCYKPFNKRQHGNDKKALPWRCCKLCKSFAKLKMYR